MCRGGLAGSLSEQRTSPSLHYLATFRVFNRFNEGSGVMPFLREPIHSHIIIIIVLGPLEHKVSAVILSDYTVSREFTRAEPPEGRCD